MRWLTMRGTAPLAGVVLAWICAGSSQATEIMVTGSDAQLVIVPASGGQQFIGPSLSVSQDFTSKGAPIPAFDVTQSASSTSLVQDYSFPGKDSYTIQYTAGPTSISASGFFDGSSGNVEFTESVKNFDLSVYITDPSSGTTKALDVGGDLTSQIQVSEGKVFETETISNFFSVSPGNPLNVTGLSFVDPSGEIARVITPSISGDTVADDLDSFTDPESTGVFYYFPIVIGFDILGSKSLEGLTGSLEFGSASLLYSPGVPELPTWLAMVVGFFGIGAGIRGTTRRRRLAVPPAS